MELHYSLDTDKFSWYKTQHEFKHVVDIKNETDYYKAVEYSINHGLKCYVLGNGSNTFFKRKRVVSVLLRNCLPEFIHKVSEDEVEVSSSTKLMKLLRYLYKEGRDGPYNLASVPGTVGGAIAMNAGTGKSEGHFIGQYLKSVVYFHNGMRVEKDASELNLGFRRSMFSERRDCFILSAKFVFTRKKFEENPITARLDWARDHQDLKVPNCGSVWRLANWRILYIAHKVFRSSPAYLSDKSHIWISNKSSDNKYILRILKFVRLLHLFSGQKCECEIRIVE